ncbi:hypothetical protein V8E51_006427 [Hyaloscypha variabilis]
MNNREPSSSVGPATTAMASKISITQAKAELDLLINNLETISIRFGTANLLQDNRAAATNLRGEIEYIQTILHPRNKHTLDEQDKAKSGVFVLRAWIRAVFPFLKKTRQKNTKSKRLFELKTPKRCGSSTTVYVNNGTPTYKSSDDDHQFGVQQSPSVQQKERLKNLEEERDADLAASWRSNRFGGTVDSGLNDSNVAFDLPAEESTIYFLEAQENINTGINAPGQPQKIRAKERNLRYHSATLSELLDAKSSDNLLDSDDQIVYDPKKTTASKTFLTKSTIYASGFQHSVFAQQRSGYKHIIGLTNRQFWEGMKTFTTWVDTCEGVLGGTVRCKNKRDVLDWSLRVDRFLETRDGAFEADLRAYMY